LQIISFDDQYLRLLKRADRMPASMYFSLGFFQFVDLFIPTVRTALDYRARIVIYYKAARALETLAS
jgi:hypothetical protein